jgi:predicted O-methyltransferase YrrM
MGKLNNQKIITTLQGRYFGLKMRLYSLLKLPAQTKKERQIFEALFDLSPKSRRLKVFEWGSGLSTLYYAQYLRRRGVDFEWHSIDNNRSWHKKVQQFVDEVKLQSHVVLHFVEFAPFWEKSGWGPVPPPCGRFAPSSENERQYVDYPRRLGDKFDVVIVDARFRRRCLQTAQEVLQPEGLVILHDAQKKQYHDGLEAYPYRRFIDSGTWYPLQKEPNRVWIGSPMHHSIFERLETL